MKIKRTALAALLALALLVSLTVPAMAAVGYSASVRPPRQSVSVGGTASVAVQLAGESTWSAGEFRFTYDAARLAFDEKSSTLPDNCAVSDANGRLTLRVYGADKNIRTPLTLAFRVTATGEAKVTLTDAYIDAGKNAANDTPRAAVTAAVAVIDCRSEGYRVTLPDWFTGEDTAYKGEDYLFTAKDTNYTYTFTGTTMNGETVSVDADDDGANFRIANVNGDIIVRAERTPRSYRVSISGSAKPDITGAASATYMTDYTFTVRRTDGYSYGTPQIRIGDAAFTGFTVSGDTYTIPGATITGNIIIRMDRTSLTPAQTVPVTITGSGAGDVKGEATAVVGQDYTFSYTEKDGYDYQLTVTAGGQRVTPERRGDGTLVIPNVTAAITIRLDKTARTTVSVQEYVKLDKAKSIYLITVQGPADAGQAYTFGDSVMYHSSAYNGWAWLVIYGGSPDTLRREAPAKVSIASAAAAEIVYSGDVNMSGTADINDVQLIWNMYNAHYASFTAMSMEKFLRADMNGDGMLNVEDAAAAVHRLG